MSGDTAATPPRLTAPIRGGMRDGVRCPPPNLIAHGFDDGTWGPFLDGGEGARLTRDSTANGHWSIRKDWRYGSFDGGTVWGQWHEPVQAVYVRFRYKQDPAFDNSGIKKLVRVQAPSFGDMFGSLIIQWGRFAWGWDGAVEDMHRALTINVGTDVRPDDLRGDWHWYEVWTDIRTDHRLRMKLWIDGHLKMDHTSTASNAGRRYGTVQFTRTFNEPAANGTTWLDDLAVSTECIGVPDTASAP